ncbi:unnamed protein product [Protopolystoma xenopodis]|uniref:Phosphofurin acidic cluster sorting protein 1/2 N-terminal C2 domain-containing protein n=1 Tax=Protopolystoma xenopodis TaxID=117903 RepID=A0A448WPD0_9PLAT|nr:unnamed protein product [Protopolystoma xenopodis]
MSLNSPISMKIQAAWDAEKSSPSVVPRVCNLNLLQIILDRPIETGSSNNSLYVAVRMRDSVRRVLRSPELYLIPPTAPLPAFNLPSLTLNVSSSFKATYTNASDSIGLSGFPSSNTTSFITHGQIGAGGSVFVDFKCEIQYSHTLKRDGNILQILLQRRKKSKTVNLGYKTLAYCNIDLAQVS